MANRNILSCVSNSAFKLIPRLFPTNSAVLCGVCKDFRSSTWNYSSSPGACHYSTARSTNSNVTDRILRFLKTNPEKVIEKMKNELNKVPTALKIGMGLYDPRPFKCAALRKPSSLYRYTTQTTKLSAKGIRHQFNCPEKEPDILNLIKQDLIIIKGSANRTRKRQLECNL